MSRPIAATKKEQEPIGYQSVTVRLPHKIIAALAALEHGKRAEFIRLAIQEKLQREGITALAANPNGAPAPFSKH